MEVYKKCGKANWRGGYRSKGEVQIARLLDRNGIACFYEHPMAVVDRGKVKIWYPDFWLRDFGMVIEYFGINGKQNYDKQARHKMEVYKQNGIEGLFLKEDCFRGDWPGRIMNQIEGILRGRDERFYDRAGRR
jgi:hypothetical protein